MLALIISITAFAGTKIKKLVNLISNYFLKKLINFQY